MGSLVYNKERFNQKIDFSGLSWKHPREYSAWGVADVDIRFELIRFNLYFGIEIKHESVDFLNECKSQKMAMFKLHQVLEKGGIVAPLAWATHNTPSSQEVLAAECIVQDYLSKGKWIHVGNKTVKEFMTAFIKPIMHPPEPPHCADCRSFKTCIFNEDCDEDDEMACPLFERSLRLTTNVMTALTILIAA